MASSILMSNSKQNSNCVPASPDVGLLSTITNSKPNPTSNSNCTLVTENQALKVTNLTPDVASLRTDVKPLSTTTNPAPPLHVVIPPSKPMILVKEVSLPSPSSSHSSTSSDLSRKEAAKNHEVRVCGWKECKAIARSLAEAFRDDEVSFYWLRTDDATHRSETDIWKLHVKVCEYVVAAHCMHGLVLSIGENHEGVALWYAKFPNETSMSLPYE
ncbi:hypothetical protein TWF106_000484 [Orbilia oligospora]|uniref:Uncharacterized protein n=1 Tax=Orbilia oligospora TaxID=2813651 RepID=A0A7C8QJC7_ORBOL|nr:hypothetical protein TWF106_000484 [Orbilia oligospora]KAF3212692.1 hypothetical protein TWF191_010436 [Orbilia oligospora]